MKEKWIIQNKKGDFDQMVEALGIDPLTARILANRGVKDVDSARFYLKGTLKDLPDLTDLIHIRSRHDHFHPSLLYTAVPLTTHYFRSLVNAFRQMLQLESSWAFSQYLPSALM